MQFKKILLILLFLFIVSFACLYFSLPDVKYLQHSNPETTALIEQRKHEAEKSGKRLRIRQKWVSYRKIPKLLKRAIRVSEDAAFYDHEGIDFFELQESVKKNIKDGKLARGGSTITQQLAKNLFLSTKKSLLRKLKEFFITMRLENELSKNRIFHLYLNIIEFGPGIFGVESASNYYFGRRVNQLTNEQIVRLAAVIPRPLSLRPNSRNRWLLWRCQWIVKKLYLYGYISRFEYKRLTVRFK